MACWRSRSTAIYPSHMRQVGESGVGNAENGRATHLPAGQPSASASPTSGNLPLRSALPTQDSPDKAAASAGGPPSSLLVMKFGGTSLADAECIARSARIAVERLEKRGRSNRGDTNGVGTGGISTERATRRPLVAVVSALAGVTNTLEDVLGRAAKGEAWEAHLGAIEHRHSRVLDDLRLTDQRTRKVEDTFATIFGELRKLLHGARLIGEATPRIRDAVAGAGERLSGPIFAAACDEYCGLAAARHPRVAPAVPGAATALVDSRDFIITDRRFGKARLLRSVTRQRTRQALLPLAGGITVVPGFIAASIEGHPTTLGRGGSDYTAAIVGAALGCSEIELWTDVDGVMSADPARVPDAHSLDEVGYEEMVELSHFGAKVVYEPTIHEARAAGAALVIRNSRNPSFAGTRLVAIPAPSDGVRVCGLTSLAGIALVRVSGPAVRGESGTRERLLRAVEMTGAPPPILVQTGSGQGVLLAVVGTECREIVNAIRAEFELEIAAARVDPPVLTEDLALLAAVGKRLEAQPGVSGRIFRALGDHGINIHAIAQGASGSSIVFCVDADAEDRSLRAAHAALFESGRDVLSGRVPVARVVRSERPSVARVYVAGHGGVGSELARQMRRLQKLPVRGSIRLETAAMAGSRWLVRGEGGVRDPRRLVSRGDGAFREQREAVADGGAELVRAVLADSSPLRIFVDCTPDVEVARLYPALLADRIAVVSANKTGFAATGAPWPELRRFLANDAQLYFETTVGAGLPVLGTIADLVCAGDTIRRIEGSLSGTLGYLSARLHDGAPFSSALREAHELGMTEPDPFVDLSGQDVKRKAVILGRVAGFDPRPEAGRPGGLVARGRGLRRDHGADDPAFWNAVAESDSLWLERVRAAKRKGRTLCHLARIAPDSWSVGWVELDPGHPAATGDPGTNTVSVWSDSYRDDPLTIHGPGAGPRVTAQGVLSDIFRAAKEYR